MKPLNTRFLTVLTTLAFLGITSFAPPLWADCPHKGNYDHKHCDTSPPDPDPDVEIYTAELTSGAFRFAAENEGGVYLIDPIYVTPGSNQGIGLEPAEDDDVEMWRPPGTDTINQAMWDRMFQIGCPNLVPMGNYVDKILSSSDNWTIEEPGNIRVILRDIRLTDSRNVEWDVTVQLIGPENYNPDDDFLPADGETPSIFTLTRGRMWGREVRGGQGGRMSCYPGGSDSGTFNLGGDSVLEIALP